MAKKTITVLDIRAFIDNLPDNTPVIIETYDFYAECELKLNEDILPVYQGDSTYTDYIKPLIIKCV
jgi:hypothetical protein